MAEDDTKVKDCDFYALFLRFQKQLLTAFGKQSAETEKPWFPCIVPREIMIPTSTSTARLPSF